MSKCSCGCGAEVGEKRFRRGHATRLTKEKLDLYYKSIVSGKTFEAIGKEFGVTRQQAFNIFKTYFPHLNRKEYKSER